MRQGVTVPDSGKGAGCGENRASLQCIGTHASRILGGYRVARRLRTDSRHATPSFNVHTTSGRVIGRWVQWQFVPTQ
jgi:hypothetical protein